MKRLLIVLALALATGSLFAQIPDFNAFKGDVQTFASSIAASLPLESSVGLDWSDSYIGQFPHFGIGLTVGGATIPFSAVKTLVTDFGGSVSGFSSFQSIGVPVPAYTLDVRIGGFVLPFDIGLKFGYLPEGAFSTSSVKADYLLVGGDVRYGLVKEAGLIPAISVGLGYTYMRGNVSVPTNAGSVTLGPVSGLPSGGTHTFTFQSPTLNFFWNTNVIDARVQVSKNLFIITPYVGLGAAYGISQAGGGLISQITEDGGTPNSQDITYINNLLGSNYSASNQQLLVTSGANGFSTRIFGGLSLNLFILKFGVGMEYEFLSGSLAGMINARVQF